MTTNRQLREAMASQLSTRLGSVIDNLQVVPRRLVSATPPSIDIYPIDDEAFYERSGFGARDYDFVLIVRARVTTADEEAGQESLYAMMDPNSPESIVRALEYDTTLGGKAQDVNVDAPTNQGLYADPAHQGGLFGCIWRTVVTI